MARQTTKPVGKKAVAGISSSKPKTSKSAMATIAKKPGAKKPLVKSTELTKVVVAPKQSTASVVKKDAIPVADKKTSATKPADKMTNLPAAKKAAAKPSLEERYRMIELAAYFIAEQHGFQGKTDEYWAAAEREIAAQLGP